MPLKPLGMEDPFSPFTNVKGQKFTKSARSGDRIARNGRNQLSIFSQVSVLFERKNLFICTLNMCGPNTYRILWDSLLSAEVHIFFLCTCFNLLQDRNRNSPVSLRQGKKFSNASILSVFSFFSKRKIDVPNRKINVYFNLSPVILL